MGRSQCDTCRRFRSAFLGPSPYDAAPTCEAFPAGIPDAVYNNAVDHRQPVSGDHGVRWESNGAPFPEYAMAGA
jgi:hypothetical protein